MKPLTARPHPGAGAGWAGQKTDVKTREAADAPVALRPLRRRPLGADMKRELNSNFLAMKFTTRIL